MTEVAVVGGGIAGAALAFHAARAGRDVLVLEAEDAAGGCLNTVCARDDFWFELGAHTFYNSYGATLELVEAAGALGELQTRAKPVLRFLDGDRVLPGKNLGLLLSRFSKLELLASVPRWFGARAEGRTAREHYGRLVGRRNYERVLGPMLSAVPSQSADEFPADILFKKRPRREDAPRSFTFRGGARRLVELALGSERIALRTGAAVEAVERDGDGYALRLASGERVTARVLALAVPPREAARLLAGLDPELAALAGAFEQSAVESVAFDLPRERVRLPEATFFIASGDRFHSIVTRDVVPHPTRRALTFHFRPETTRAERLARAGEVLGLGPEELGTPHETRSVLPSPRLGHAERVAAVDRALAGRALALTGNWFGGLAVEDCVLRSRAEWRRLESLPWS